MIFSNKVIAQGCLINAFDQYNKVFNKPTASGATTFESGDGKNFVRWEGQCGPHIYIETLSTPSGTCSVDGRQGDYYPVVSAPFPRTCDVPIDENILVLILASVVTSLWHLKSRCQAD